jgi:hypothetical protein
MWLSMWALTLLLPVRSEPTDARYPVRETDSVRRTLRFTASTARTLEVRNVNGAIRVVGTDADTVDLVANRTINAESQSAVAEARRIVRLETAEAIGGLNVCADASVGCRCDDRLRSDTGRSSTSSYRVDVDLELRVPRDAALRLCTINRGDITLEHTAGAFDVSHVNGGITLSDIRGSGRAATVNGGVMAAFSDVMASASSFRTVNGDVVVTLPDNVSLDLRLKTSNGGLFTAFDTTVLASQPVGRERHGSAVVSRSRRDTRVRVGGGGPELSLETVNGDVRVLRR